jgi:hypothetical protein
MYFISVHIELYAVKTRLLDAENNGIMAKAGKEYKELLEMVAYLHKGSDIMG